MRVAVTGASGFVGTNLIADLRQSGFDVVPVARSPSPDGAWRQSPCLEDSEDVAGWTHAFAGVDAVVHTAAKAHALLHDREDAERVMRVNRDGALTAFRGAQTAGVGKFVFLSTVKVLGESTSRRGPFADCDSPDPRDPYAASKLAAERLLAEEAEKSAVDLVVLRLPLVYGPGVGGNLAALSKLLVKGIPLPFGSVTSNRRSMLSTPNLASAVTAALRTNAAGGEPLLVSDGHDISTRELIDLLARSIGVESRLLPIPVPLLRGAASLVRKGAMADRLLGDLCVDIGRARDRLGWHPPLTVEQGFKIVGGRNLVAIDYA